MMEKKIKISPAKGRPMLYWVGKRPLDYVKGFPAQLTEIFNPSLLFSPTRGEESKQKVIATPHFDKSAGEVISYDALKNNWYNLLFHGDNKDVLATLLESGFRGTIDLIYIDPPFKSGADYIRKVELRGLKDLGRVEQDDASFLQQTMYFDIWNNDTYLQFMYERLMLLKELLSEMGSIFIHLDWHVGHYVKLLMDEVFGQDNFRNEIIVRRVRKNVQEHEMVKSLNTDQDIVLFYAKSDQHRIRQPRINKGAKPRWHSFEAAGYRKGMDYELFGFRPTTGNHWRWSNERAMAAAEKGDLRSNPETGKPEYLVTKTEEIKGSLWDDIQAYSFDTGFLTQKHESLLCRVMEMSSKEGDLVLDCFIGSGTTAAVAQKLGRRWIGCDINKGAIQMTSKRLQKTIVEQIKNEIASPMARNDKPSPLPSPLKGEDKSLPRTGFGGEGEIRNDSPIYNFAIYKVNDYDLQLLKTEATELAVQHIGIQRTKIDAFFEGFYGKSLAKIIDFNHPLTLLDLQLIQDELKKRPDEERDITIVCLGKETAVDPWVAEWNKKHPVNKIKIIELKTDSKYGTFLVHKPVEAEIEILRVTQKKDEIASSQKSGTRNDKKVQNDKAVITINAFISPTIIERLNIDQKIWKVKIPDFRAMIDTVLIDTNYDSKVFNIVFSDVPEKKSDLVQGTYEIEITKKKTNIAVKIIDMLGEELLYAKEI